jgi:hypothetical protein
MCVRGIFPSLQAYSFACWAKDLRVRYSFGVGSSRRVSIARGVACVALAKSAGTLQFRNLYIFALAAEAFAAT